MYRNFEFENLVECNSIFNYPILLDFILFSNRNINIKYKVAKNNRMNQSLSFIGLFLAWNNVSINILM